MYQMLEGSSVLMIDEELYAWILVSGGHYISYYEVGHAGERDGEGGK